MDHLSKCLRPPAKLGAAILSAAFVSASLARASGPVPPLPDIPTAQPFRPGPDALADRPELPDVLTMDDGTKVTAPAQWEQRRTEMRRTLEYYAVGLAPPPPGNVRGELVSTQPVLNGSYTYRLVKLTFGPDRTLFLHVGLYTPAGDPHVPAVVLIDWTSPPGAPELPKLPNGATQGSSRDALSVVGPATRPARAIARRAQSAEDVAARSPAIAHGYALATFNYTDCGEDTTLRNDDGSWAYRGTRLFAAYPSGYDWGLARAWAWGASRVADYLETDRAFDAKKLIVTGVSRNGKAALVAGAFDERFALVAPVASSGGGTPAYRFSGADRGGNEGLTEMTRKYPNWFSPHLRPFMGRPEKLPFDQHWLVALAAPRPLIALEGTRDPNVNHNGVRQSFLGAQPAYALLNAADHLAINWADRPHGMVQSDWDALFALADHTLMGKATTRKFDSFPEDK